MTQILFNISCVGGTGLAWLEFFCHNMTHRIHMLPKFVSANSLKTEIDKIPSSFIFRTC